MVSFRSLKEGYEHNWANLIVRMERREQATAAANRLLNGKVIYQQIESKSGVPWWFVGLFHYRESYCNFKT
ncbi:hypothetical protein XH86_05245 [Bradyrhizobium guangdongense]|uniref:Uncharacterized protein n=1 Tax=Bradyrhizobium guangdongense TaxID=1325090 RepID=A0A7S7V116_9BRAD|nr:hypothetical protein XH86_05245 [Bradyrhizobium guangdongense]